MFSVLGLAIAQSCVLSVCPVDVMPMVELASGGGPESVEVYGMAHRISRQDLKMDCPFLPTWGPDARVVEVVARAASDPNYAVLARQMNYLYCAVAGTVQDWSTAFRGLVQRHVRGLCARPLAEFAWTEWPIGLEGVHEFSLAVNDHTSRAFLMTLFFKFSRRTMFSAELQQEGSTEVGMMLRPEGGWTSRGTRRVDASQGEGLRICLPLSSECDPNVGGGYWRLEVVNWDREREARCRLRISVEPSAVVEFPNGLRVSAGQPPKDAQTIRYLVRCVQGEDAGLWLDAEAALLAVGPQALPELRQALTLSKGDCRKRLRDVELKLLMEPD